jgi:hypothetical protein
VCSGCSDPARSTDRGPAAVRSRQQNEWSVEHDRQDWPPLSTLVALELELVGNATEDDDEWIDRAAAVKTVRDYYTQARAERAKLN